jgi:hypothetical protein
MAQLFDLLFSLFSLIQLFVLTVLGYYASFSGGAYFLPATFVCLILIVVASNSAIKSRIALENTFSICIVAAFWFRADAKTIITFQTKSVVVTLAGL